ncbi:hypothetical protein OCU04_009654 [Sclerotinia nivalis]|uniref:Uncharacterized protein n=1 Tax=Sclerotinia nivalis TaxID=352851 RepID=A0A9X0DGB3_9HELO|nr:hypothetical protein OCU04_009654 [Sclerotinia nivalis]
MTGIFNHPTKKKNKRILERLCNDVRTKFTEEKDITIVVLQDTPTLYLEAVFNERLRSCNPIPSGLPRVVPEGEDDYSEIFLPGGVSTYESQRGRFTDSNVPEDGSINPYIRDRSPPEDLC